MPELERVIETLGTKFFNFTARIRGLGHWVISSSVSQALRMIAQSPESSRLHISGMSDGGTASPLFCSLLNLAAPVTGFGGRSWARPAQLWTTRRVHNCAGAFPRFYGRTRPPLLTIGAAGFVEGDQNSQRGEAYPLTGSGPTNSASLAPTRRNAAKHPISWDPSGTQSKF